MTRIRYLLQRNSILHKGGMLDRLACMAGGHACMARGVCMSGGMHGREGTHPTGMHSCFT